MFGGDGRRIYPERKRGSILEWDREGEREEEDGKGEKLASSRIGQKGGWERGRERK